jgi:GNAT superfamily N-acetyltransferase
MAGVEFAWLAERPQYVPRLAALHHAEWSWIDPEWTLEEAHANLAIHTAGTAIPTTRLALVDGELAGSVSLLANDHSRIRKWSPWLASLLVLPEFRGRGIGAALVREAVAIAARFGIARLYLYTDDAAPFYARLGWSLVERAPLDGMDVDVMAIDIGAIDTDAATREAAA